MIEVNEKYFDDINTEEKAYWLGFIWADGYVSTSAPWTLIIQIKDTEHLKKFSDAIMYKGTIKKSNSGGFENSSEMSRLVICRKYICEALNKLGKNNSELFIPKIQEDLINHFIRGFFDGDGSVYTYLKSGIPKNAKRRYTYNKIECSIIGKMSILSNIKENLYDIKTRYKDSKTEYMKYLCISNNEDVIKFFNYLYKDATVFLERKYLKFINYYGPIEE